MSRALDNHLSEGRRFMKARDFERAHQEFTHALDIDRDCREARENRDECERHITKFTTTIIQDREEHIEKHNECDFCSRTECERRHRTCQDRVEFRRVDCDDCDRDCDDRDRRRNRNGDCDDFRERRGRDRDDERGRRGRDICDDCDRDCDDDRRRRMVRDNDCDDFRRPRRNECDECDRPCDDDRRRRNREGGCRDFRRGRGNKRRGEDVGAGDDEDGGFDRDDRGMVEDDLRRGKDNRTRHGNERIHSEPTEKKDRVDFETINEEGKAKRGRR